MSFKMDHNKSLVHTSDIPPFELIPGLKELVEARVACGQFFNVKDILQEGYHYGLSRSKVYAIEDNECGELKLKNLLRYIKIVVEFFKENQIPIEVPEGLTHFWNTGTTQDDITEDSNLEMIWKKGKR